MGIKRFAKTIGRAILLFKNKKVGPIPLFNRLKKY